MERVLTSEEEGRLLSACDNVRSDFLKSAVILAIHTGLRRGELLSLEWARIDLVRNSSNHQFQV